MKKKKKLKEALAKGMIKFNPFTMDMNPKRYEVLYMPTTYEGIIDNDISELIVECMVDCKDHSRFMDNLYVDIYGLGSYAEVTWLVSFDTVKELDEYMKKQNLNKVIINDTEKQSITEHNV